MADLLEAAVAAAIAAARSLQPQPPIQRFGTAARPSAVRTFGRTQAERTRDMLLAAKSAGPNTRTISAVDRAGNPIPLEQIEAGGNTRTINAVDRAGNPIPLEQIEVAPPVTTQPSLAAQREAALRNAAAKGFSTAILKSLYFQYSAAATAEGRIPLSYASLVGSGGGVR